MSETRRAWQSHGARGAGLLVIALLIGIACGTLGWVLADQRATERDSALVERDDAESEQAVAETEQALTAAAADSLLDEFDAQLCQRRPNICAAAERVAETITGAPGPQGTTGPTGATGADGEDGARGPRGFIGPVGPAGPTGATGDTGGTGTPGAPGATGPAGQPGEPGPAGPKGEPGKDGADGTATPGTYTCPDPDQYIYGITFNQAGDVTLDCRADNAGPLAP